MKEKIKAVGLLLTVILLTGGCAHIGNSVPASGPSYNTAKETAERDEGEVSFEKVPQPVLSPENETGRLKLDHAREFSVRFYGDDYTLIDIAATGEYLVVEEGAGVPEELDEDIVVLRKPFEHTYLAASSVMDFYRELGILDRVGMTSTKYEDWSIDEVKRALYEGDMEYVGKYNAPDYEYVLESGCDLAVESTMIYHSPEVKEKLEELNIPVMVEHSSYERDPLGRLEWIKLYGILNDRQEEAGAFYEEAVKKLESVTDTAGTGKTAAFFCFTANGGVSVRKENDYVAKMIGLAGAEYVPRFEEGDGAQMRSSVTIQSESFYEKAHAADFLIYNSTISGEVDSLEDLFEKNDLIREFKAVKEGQVWCTRADMFQRVTAAADITAEFHEVFSGNTDGSGLMYLYRLK